MTIQGMSKRRNLQNTVHERAKQCLDPLQVIISESCSTTTQYVAGKMPLLDSLRKALRNVPLKERKAIANHAPIMSF